MCEDTFVRMERIRNSGINDAFVPTKPVSTNFFCGRKVEVERIVNSIVNSGAHVLLYGDRGVGKTSLATHACELLLSHSWIDRFVPVGCNRNDKFEDIMRQLFLKLGYTQDTKRTTTNTVEGGIAFAKGSRSTSSEEDVYYDYSSPRWVAEQISDINMVVIVDEFDTITDTKEKEKFSQLIKIISDRGAKLSLLIVGIAVSASDLLEGHMSVARSLTEVRLDRMSNEELQDIIRKGEDRTGLQFEEVVKQRIIATSFGFPYFTHLLALKSAEEAVVSELNVVTEKMLNDGLQKALVESLQSFKDKYDNAIGSNEMKRKVIYCCALLGNREFSAEELRNKYHEIYNEHIESVSVGNAIHNALSETPDTILRRRRVGVYYFNDPRMPVYILMLHDISGE